MKRNPVDGRNDASQLTFSVTAGDDTATLQVTDAAGNSVGGDFTFLLQSDTADTACVTSASVGTVLKVAAAASGIFETTIAKTSSAGTLTMAIASAETFYATALHNGEVRTVTVT